LCARGASCDLSCRVRNPARYTISRTRRPRAAVSAAEGEVEVEYVMTNSGTAANICGMKLPLQGRALFILVGCGAIASAMGFAVLQEGVWRIPGYKFSGWMTFVTAATMCACGMIERVLTGDIRRVGTLQQYLKLSVLTLGGMYFTNWSLEYLNYATRVVFKSSKLLPTMIVGTLMQGRWYSVLEYVAAGGLVCGIVLFTLGDAAVFPAFHPIGIGLIVIGMGLDAATSNYEEAAFFRVPQPASQAEVVAFSSLFGSAWGLMLLLPTEEFGLAVKHSIEHSEVLPYLVMSSVCGYVSVSFVLLLIKLYGATVTEMVKSLRKVLTVVISFVLYPKPVSWKYGLGGVFVLVSLIATQELQRRKGGDVRHTPSKEIGEAVPLTDEPDADISVSSPMNNRSAA